MKSKKFLSLLMAVMMCATLFAITVAAESTLTLSKCNVTTKAVRLAFNEDLTNFTATLFDAANNKTAVTTSTSAKDATVKIDVPMALDTTYYLSYTATSASGTLEGRKKITCNKIWADDFEGYNEVSELSANYTANGGTDFSTFKLVKDGDNTYLKMTGNDVFLKPNTSCAYTATYEIDTVSVDPPETSVNGHNKSSTFLILVCPWGTDRSYIQASPWDVKYQGFITASPRYDVIGETFAFIRETSGVQNSSFYAAAFCNGNFLGEHYNASDDWVHGYTDFAISKWHYECLIDNMKIYTVSEEDVSTTIALENVSATKSEVTLDYSAEVINGNFTLTKGGATVNATVSKTNNGKTVVITPDEPLTLDTVYELQASNIPDYNGGTIPEYNQTFMLKTLFADNFDSYKTAADMDGVWNVSYQSISEIYTVSGFNTFAGKNVFYPENGRLVVNGNFNNGTINIKSYDASEWNKYTLEVDVAKDNGARYALDILYHMHRNGNKTADYTNNFRLGIWGDYMAEACFTTEPVKTSTGYDVFTSDKHHLKFATKTGKDLQVFKDGTNVLSQTYNNTLGIDGAGGEIGFKAIWDGYKSYIDNVLVYKLVELDNNQNNIFVKVANVTETGVTGTYTLAKYDSASIDKADVIVAAYGKSNKLLGTQVITLDSVTSHNGGFSFNCNTPEDVVYVKACLWNSVDGMTPAALSGSKTIGYQTNK